jgi:hypothetical protein
MRRLRITRTQICLAVAALLFLIGIGDFVHSVKQVPPQHAPCVGNIFFAGSDAQCQRADEAHWNERVATVDRLTQNFNDRTLIYGIGASLALLLAVYLSYPTDEAKRRRYFATIGSAGVVVLVVTTGLLTAAHHTVLRDVGGLGPGLPILALLGAAVLGGSISRRGEGPAAARPDLWTPPKRDASTESQTTGGLQSGALVATLPFVAWGFVVLTAVFLSSWAGNQPNCGSGDPLPSSAALAHQLAYATTAAAAMSALILLFVRRRWLLVLTMCLGGALVYFWFGLEVGLRCD